VLILAGRTICEIQIHAETIRLLWALAAVPASVWFHYIIWRLTICRPVGLALVWGWIGFVWGWWQFPRALAVWKLCAMIFVIWFADFRPPSSRSARAPSIGTHHINCSLASLSPNWWALTTPGIWDLGAGSWDLGAVLVSAWLVLVVVHMHCIFERNSQITENKCHTMKMLFEIYGNILYTMFSSIYLMMRWYYHQINANFLLSVLFRIQYYLHKVKFLL